MTKSKRPKPKLPVGRPSEYDPDFHPGSYLQLASEGKTKAQICTAWGIHRGTLFDWSSDKRRAELLNAIKRGDEARATWWTNFATGLAAGQIKGNPTMTIFLMKNILPTDFKDRIDHSHTLDVEDMIFEEDA